jgi:MFS family permease
VTGVLRNRAFRWVGSIYLLNSLLEWFGSVALMVLVYRHTQSTSIAAGLLLCKQVAPGVLVPLVSAKLDRLSVERVLSAALTLQAVTLLLIGVVGYGPAVFVLAVVSGIAGTLVRSTLRAGVARSLGEADLRSGNALLNVALGATSLIGPALAAATVTAVNTRPAFVGAGVLMILCALAARSVIDLPPTNADAEHAEATVDTADKPVSRSPKHVLVPVSWLLLLVGVLSCVFSMDNATLLAYSEDSLGAGVPGYGAIFAAWGVGLIIGGAIFSRLLEWPMLRIYAVATVLAGGAYLGMSVSPTIYVACAFAVLGGVGNGMDWIALVTAVQEAAPQGQEARYAARLESIASVGPAVGIVLGGVLADLTTPRLVMVVPGAAALLLLGAGYLAVRARSVRLRTGTQLFSPSIPGGSV